MSELHIRLLEFRSIRHALTLLAVLLSRRCILMTTEAKFYINREAQVPLDCAKRHPSSGIERIKDRVHLTVSHIAGQDSILADALKRDTDINQERTIAATAFTPYSENGCSQR